MSIGHYAVLKVARDARSEDIRKSYRRLSQEWHLKEGSKAGADRSGIDAINLAYKTLSDDASRAIYDQQINAGAGAAPVVAPSAPTQSAPLRKARWVVGAMLAAAALAIAAVLGSQSSDQEKPAGIVSEASSRSTASSGGVAVDAGAGAGAVEAPELLAASLIGEKRREEERRLLIEKAKEDKLKEDKLKEMKAKEDELKEVVIQKEKNRADDLASKAQATPVRTSAPAFVAAPAVSAEPAPSVAIPTLISTPSAAPNLASGPKKALLQAHAACPKQVAPEMPIVSKIRNASVLVEADVRAQVTIQGGAVRDVKILSGPRAYHASVLAAVRKYGCVNTQEESSFLQDFHFVPPPMD
jgi:curved DNA-binding protein CbpA